MQNRELKRASHSSLSEQVGLDRDHWVLIADASGARLFSCDATLAPLRLVRELDHPEGRLRNQDLESDRPGRASGGRNEFGAITSSDAARHQSELFARQLAEVLERGLAHGDYRLLVLAAPPVLLGQLRGALTPAVERAVAASVARDFVDRSEQELPGLLRHHLPDDAGLP
jgi:protein required for attachment to host cells